jgi:peptidoglycan/xylan/chitin deacetylase (PgdA/CDA1 family)
MKPAIALMYHRLGQGALPGREAGEESYAVTPEAFEAHLEALDRSRARVVGLDGLGAGGDDLQVLLTFDDGNASDHDVALPALRRRGHSAVFFVTPAWVGTPGYMTWAQVRELDRDGMTVGVHGLDHTPLSSLEKDALRLHLAEARAAFEPHIGRRPDTLSLPGGYGSPVVAAIAREEGFRTVFGSAPERITRLAPDTIVPRFAVRRGAGLNGFLALVEQRPLALAGHRVRYAALQALRSAVGAGLYRRVRDLRMRWGSAS